MSVRDDRYSIDNVPREAGQNALRTLVDDHDPDHIYAAVSGGDDSITALHFAATSDIIDLDGVVHLDTGVGVEKTRKFVEAQCKKLGLDLVVLGNENARFGHERYEHLVKSNGFPGANPIAHSQMWKNLKDKPLGKFRRNLDGELALISGVRKHESDNRYERLSHTGVQEVSNIVWASPLVEFTDKDLTVYRNHHNIDENPVAALLCTSGECLCGSYGDRNNLPLIKQYFPAVAQQIFQLEWDVLERVARGEIKEEYALWAHGSVDAGEYSARTDANQTGLMCSDCDERCPADGYELTGDPQSPAEAFLRANDLRDFWTWPFYCAPCDQVVQDPYTHRQNVHPFDTDVRSGLEAAWDMRQIDVGASHEAGAVITEPNGWNLHPNQLTRDEREAEQYKTYYYYENVSLFLCDPGKHEWEPYNGGPVKECQKCFAFNLSEYDAEEPGEPAVQPAAELDEELSPEAAEAAKIHQTLSEFTGGESSLPADSPGRGDS